jgi:DNA replication protein DnaC/transposase
MLTVEDYCNIRIAHRDGMSIRQIARRFGHSRRKVRQALEESEPRPYTLQQDRPAPRLGPYKTLIEQILTEDQQAPAKQQHTAAKLYRRLRDEHGYAGGYDQVRRYVSRLCRAERETFIPLTHPPGRRLEADFGHIYVDFPEGNGSSSRSIIWRSSVVGRRLWIIPSCSINGNCRPASTNCGRSWKSVTARRRVRGSTFGSCNCWPNTPCRWFRKLSFNAGPRPPSTPITSLPRSGGSATAEPPAVMTKPTASPPVMGARSRFRSWTTLTCCYPFDKEISMTMDNERRLLAVHLKRLRLPTILAEYDKLAQEAAQENAHYLQYLLRLVELESAQRCAHALQSRIKQAAFPVYKDLDSYDFSLMPSLNKQKIVELTRCQWLDQHENLCLLGSQGVGKTHLAIALGLAACRAGRRVRFFTAAALVNRLEETQKQYQLDRFLSRLDRTDLLICDELGYLSFSRTENPCVAGSW